MARSCSPVTQPLAWHAVTDCSPVFLPLALPFPTRASPPCLRLFVLFANRQYFSTAHLAWRGSPWLARAPAAAVFATFPIPHSAQLARFLRLRCKACPLYCQPALRTLRPCPFAPALSPFPLGSFGDTLSAPRQGIASHPSTALHWSWVIPSSIRRSSPSPHTRPLLFRAQRGGHFRCITISSDARKSQEP